jgi:selenocysteine lyase/cysteine desulfurase
VTPDVLSGSPRLTRRALGCAAVTACIAPLAWATEKDPGHGGGTARSWRDDFPALAQRIEGRPLVYLDSAATTQRPTPVIEAIVEFYRRDNANPGRALHGLARRAHERYEGARATVAQFINAGSSGRSSSPAISRRRARSA